METHFQASFNGFYINSITGLRHDRAGEVKLQPKELKVLVTLVRNPGQLVTRDVLLKSVWGSYEISDSSLGRCISKIKSGLNKAKPGSASLIKTKYGEGYSFTGYISSSLCYLSEDCFNTLVDLSPDFIALKDELGRWVAANVHARNVLNLEGKNWLGKTDLQIAEMLSPANRPLLKKCALSDEKTWRDKSPSDPIIEVIVQSDGSKRYFEVVKSPHFHLDGNRKSMVVFGHDVTKSIAERNSVKLANHVLENSHEAVLITDANNNIVSVNRAYTDISGYTLEDVVGKNPRINSSGLHDSAFYRSMWHQISTEGVWRGEILDKKKNGEIYPKWLDISAVHDTDGNLTNYIGIFSDLTEKKNNEEKIRFLAFHDPLTKLPNRLLLRDRFDQAIAIADRENKELAFLFIDIDKFKQVNDSLGHLFGDQLLLLVADRLSLSVRDTDTVARFGGDEFVILLTCMQADSAVSNIAEKILKDLSSPFLIGSVELNSSSSIGIAMYPDDGKDFDTLLKMADTAMYQSKNGGKNTYRFFTEKMNIEAVERLHLQNAMHQALRNAEFELHYQPQFDLKEMKLVGVEALIRWNGVSPHKIISAAEEGGLIVPLGEWILYEACRQARDWQDTGCPPFNVAVNISALQFMRGNIVQTVKNALEKTKLAANYLELELTESILIQDVEKALQITRELKQMGISLSIDDFGTGFSGLAYLKTLPVDKLKIDQSFVRNMTVDADDAAIVHSIIHLAHNLKLKVVAEGVETKLHAAHLLREGCDEVQGFLFGHPMPANEIRNLLHAGKTLIQI